MARRDGVWLAAMASMVLGAACGSADTPAGPTHTTHAMVGTSRYDGTFVARKQR